MEVIKEIEKIRHLVEKKRAEGAKIGLVPTMGAIHEGHVSLIKLACEMTDYVVVSVFVNPTQFGPGEDFKKYPRNPEKDMRTIDSAGAHCIFSPEISEMYPGEYSTYITVEELTKGLCGRSRPEHFRGVTTVVTKLFNIVDPHIAVFGQKDAQQLAVIRKMVDDLNMTVKIVTGSIVRAQDGLALSSRNMYLSGEERKQATVLYRSLCMASEMAASGVTEPEEILGKVREVITGQDAAKIDYIEIVDKDRMTPVTKISDSSLLAVAVWFGKTRLIDNIILNGKNG
ncbi:MAG: pantoate--beta-alanine ligase [Candidatus Latescibacteria bacterium]|nr:pantoate--beta-alanine ligase [Candidatus Latescibacterota bacterium]